MTSAQPDLSIVVPVYNEVESLAELHRRLTDTLTAYGRPYEIILVDDGSRDGSRDVLRQLAADDPHTTAILFRRNFGQTAAMQAGFDHARGAILLPLDADLQNDPADIPRLVAKLDEGYDIVSGWREKRNDDPIRTLPSRLANQLIQRVTGVPIHDTGCTLKAYRREALEPVRLYGQLHRFIPALAAGYGARVGELPVTHHPRQHGQSKYGIGRTTKVILDLILVKFLLVSATRPIHAIGRWGLLSWAFTLLFWFLGLFRGETRGYWWLSGLLTLCIGTQLVATGLVAELLTRAWHEGTGRKTYWIAEVLGAPAEA